MVTVIHVTLSEAAAALAATSAASSSSPVAAAADSIMKTDPGCDTDRVQHPSISFDNIECDHQGEKKRNLQPNHLNSIKQVKKRQKFDAFIFDLRDVPYQLPISKHADRVKEGASKYQGVYFEKSKKTWKAQISIHGKDRHIGCYDKEEEAAVDYARAVFKYKGQDALHKARERNASEPAAADLSDVPPQSPIPKPSEYTKEGASKYQGVCFNKEIQKWTAQLKMNDKVLQIGCYKNEEEAAVDYARELFKYKGQGALGKARKRNSSGYTAADLRDIPPQPPILKSANRIKKGSSKYQGVSFNNVKNKWRAAIRIDGKDLHIGYYKKEEEAAADYARAVFKYRG